MDRYVSMLAEKEGDEELTCRYVRLEYFDLLDNFEASIVDSRGRGGTNTARAREGHQRERALGDAVGEVGAAGGEGV